ncbi:putative transmembrane protein [Senna tora]|uniref:Putative transmembrane protein n=1 Tax=Senna tora TaxID=362788 RepID=A0A834TQ16_9FABA|nr:putative transmembrane protein [Senna tora]
MISSIPTHAVFVFVDPLLLALLQAEHQNKPKSPFEAHPLNMWIFLMAICFYSTILGVKKKKSSESGYYYYGNILNNMLILLGCVGCNLNSVLGGMNQWKEHHLPK